MVAGLDKSVIVTMQVGPRVKSGPEAVASSAFGDSESA